jgi:geranylgeranyl pyrophosphate synthase
MNAPVEARLAELAARVDGELEDLLANTGIPSDELRAATRHPVLAGGKRLRPALVLETARLLGASDAEAMPGALAVELIHTYSLVHDDLPSMDDDDLRRGKPTVHKLYGEAMGILVGDGLQTLAFEVLLSGPGPVENRCEAALILARAAGLTGMVGGQVLDLEGEGQAPDLERVRAIHERKTLALLQASVEMGAALGGANPEQRAALACYGRAVGLAFQIVDDILDETATAEELGKSPGKDRSSGKLTWPACIGIEESRRQATSLVQEAREALNPLHTMDLDPGFLQDLSIYIVDRRL